MQGLAPKWEPLNMDKMGVFLKLRTHRIRICASFICAPYRFGSGAFQRSTLPIEFNGLVYLFSCDGQ